GQGAVRGKSLSALDQDACQIRGLHPRWGLAHAVSLDRVATCRRRRRLRHSHRRLRHRPAGDRRRATIPWSARARHRSEPRQPKLREAKDARIGSWIKMHVRYAAYTLDGALRMLFPSIALQPVAGEDGCDILIAGCGTGRQAIDAAQRFHGARVLAIDLSLGSLSYAKRKTRELDL